MGSRSQSRSRTRSPPRRAPSRSPVRGRSPSRSPPYRARSRSESPQTESIVVTNDDAAFILGRGGSTKNKLARVSGARLELEERDLRLSITGTKVARRRAREYVGFVMAQRVGPVSVDVTDPRPDLTVVDVPDDCVGYIMGKQGQALRGMEDEWGTLMFFARVSAGLGANGPEKLAIFGTRRARRGAELKVMSAVEHKKPGHFVDSEGRLKVRLHQAGDDDDGDWDYETARARPRPPPPRQRPHRLRKSTKRGAPDETSPSTLLAQIRLADDEFSYALGGQGATRKKLARAADCIMEYVGNVAVIAGFKEERKRGRDYLTWLLTQRRGIVQVDTRARDDVTAVEVPRETVGFITGHKGEGLREIERLTGTFIFSDGERGGSRSNPGYESILVFGASKAGRKDAKKMIEERMREKEALGDRRGGGGGGGYGGGGSGRGGYNDRRGGGGGGGGDRDYRRDDRERDRRRSRSRSRDRDRRRNRSRSR